MVKKKQSAAPKFGAKGFYVKSRGRVFDSLEYLKDRRDKDCEKPNCDDNIRIRVQTGKNDIH